MGFYFNLEVVLIDYLEFIYDKRDCDGIGCTMVMLQIHTKKRYDDIKMDLKPAINQGLLALKRNHFYALTREGEKYVENYRYGKANDRDNKEQPQG